MGQRIKFRTQREHNRSVVSELAIREAFNASQNQMTDALNLKVPLKLLSARVSEFEHGKREPNMIVLLAYARLAGIPLELIVDDQALSRDFVMRSLRKHGLLRDSDGA